ncbi:hypothetical protein V502_07812 [Pseudogymnoascus sp. VKM F-4520 (FW-2644)]|nr:hypothetical protein V502_07812 [Pseudogymnoascus sp. VKM F-4520 (FW-2644)]
MASIMRSLRPVATRFAARTSSGVRTQNFAIRSFSARSAGQAKKFTTEHEWVELSEDGKTGTLGISDYAAHALGDVVYVELPTLPMEVEAGDTIGAVESVKSASDINSPITCTITEVNNILEEKPGTINNAPEDIGAGGGWIAKVEIGEQGIKDLEGLMDAAAYKEFSASE